MKKNDLLLVCALLAAAGLAFVCARLFTGGEARTATLEVDGAVVWRASLDADERYEWTDGERALTVVVTDGAARIEQSNCPNQDCVRVGAISTDGAAVVCLPCRATLRLSGDGGPDAVAK